jgi:MFS family permease
MKKTGVALLILLTLVNLLNYFDRYILVAVVPVIQKDMLLSDAQVGFLGTAFMVLYFVVSPLFGWLGDRTQRFRLISVGVGLWSIATALSGLAQNYISLLWARIGVGVGEASYVAVSPALMGDLFPKNRRGRIFAIFFMAIPVGSAMGYLIGGLLELHFGWRTALLLAGGPGLVLSLLLFFMKDPPRGQYDDVEDLGEKNLPFSRIVKELARNTTYIYTVLGYIAYTFVVGGVSFWMPSYLLRVYHLQASTANMIFGGVTVVGGLVGTLVGGYWADRWLKKDKKAYLKLSGLSAAVAGVIFILVLLVQNLYVALGLIFVLEFFLFLSTSPINAEIVDCVPVAYRSTANAICVFMIHLFGDAASPTLIGVVSDHAGLKTALSLGPLGIILSGFFWFYGAHRSAAKS